VRERHAPSRRSTLLTGLVVFTVLTTSTQDVAWAAVPSQPPPVRIVGTAFHAAAMESGVPEELLLAIGYVNTHWRMEVSDDRGVGIMHLIHDPQSDTLTKAAQLTGASESALSEDVMANVRGGAAVISAAAGSSKPVELNGWRPVVASVGAGLPYADQVFWALKNGASEMLPSGEYLVLSPHPAAAATSGAARAASPDYGQADWAPASTNNYTGSSRPSIYIPNRIIIHVTQGSYASAIHYFQNPAAQASAHFVARSADGAITQTVREQDVAWHAGNWDYNTKSVGIEHEGFVDNPAWFTDSMYRASAQLSASIVKKYSIPIDRQHIVGHNEVPDPLNPTLTGGRDHHSDPGRFWNWNLYMSYVRGYAGAYCVSNGGGSWRWLPGGANDVGVGSSGAAWVIGSDPDIGGYGIYSGTGSGWTRSSGAATRVAVDPAGVPWIVNVYNTIYRRSGGGWQQLPGAAMDVAVGADGSVWIVGTNETLGGFGIYRWTGGGWQSIDGGGSRIAVGPDGKPSVVNSWGAIYQRGPSGWVQLPGAAYDVAVAADSLVTIVGINRLCGGYGLWTWNGSSWSSVAGAAIGLSLGPDRKAWVVNESQAIYRQA
jgi:N-acetyl-anhydromuramyl-L-alanine amidase AmpD